VVVASADPWVRRHWVASLGGVAGGVEALDSLAKLRERLATRRPFVSLVDLALPGLRGARGLRSLAAIGGRGALVALGDSSRERLAISVLRAGARGLAPRRIEPKAAAKLVRAVRRGELWVSRRVLGVLMDELAPFSRERRGLPLEPLGPLTPREREVVELVAAGARNKQIAARLGIEEATVKAHLGSVFRKLGIPDRLRLALWWLSGGGSGSVARGGPDHLLDRRRSFPDP
jgi:DNA-binding NarL/FixJ family response regulator